MGQLFYDTTGGGGGGDNYSSANLIAGASRTHTWAGNRLTETFTTNERRVEFVAGGNSYILQYDFTQLLETMTGGGLSHTHKRTRGEISGITTQAAGTTTYKWNPQSFLSQVTNVTFGHTSVIRQTDVNGEAYFSSENLGGSLEKTELQLLPESINLNFTTGVEDLRIDGDPGVSGSWIFSAGSGGAPTWEKPHYGEFADDAAAGSGGCPVGGVYMKTGSPNRLHARMAPI